MKMINEILASSVWNVESIEDQPEVVLTQWKIMEASYADGTKTRHIIGYEPRFYQGRVSSAIKSIDLTSQKIFTASGRCYEFAGEPGNNSDALYVWGTWKYINKVVSEVDVTSDVQFAFSKGSSKDE